MRKKYIEISLNLKRKEEFFEGKQVDYFKEIPVLDSGIEIIFNKLMSERSNLIPNVKMILPENAQEPYLEEKILKATRQYSSHNIRKKNTKLIQVRWILFRSFQIGIIFLLSCLILSLIIQQLTSIPELLRLFLSEGLIIAGWVSMWRPLETLLYGFWPHWRELKILKNIMQMKIQIFYEKEKKKFLQARSNL